MFLKFVFLKAHVPIENQSFDFKYKLPFKLKQSSNADDHIHLTFCGIIKSPVKPLHDLNAPECICSRDSGNTIFVNFLHPLNAKSVISFNCLA